MKKWNAYIDSMESIILGHACAGMDVMAKAYVEGLNSAYEAYINNIDEDEEEIE